MPAGMVGKGSGRPDKGLKQREKPDSLSVLGFRVISPKARIFEEKRYDLNCGTYSNHICNQLINDHAIVRRANRSVDRSLVPGLLWEQMRKPRGFESLHSDQKGLVRLLLRNLECGNAFVR